MPSLERLHNHFKGKPFAYLAVNVGEGKETVERFVRSRGLTFKVLLDEDGGVAARYGVRSHPMKFLIDAEGDLVGLAMGYREWDTEEMKSVIRQLLASRD